MERQTAESTLPEGSFWSRLKERNKVKRIARVLDETLRTDDRRIPSPRARTIGKVSLSR